MAWNNLSFKHVGDDITYADMNKIRENINYLVDAFEKYHYETTGLHKIKRIKAMACYKLLGDYNDLNEYKALHKNTSHNVISPQNRVRIFQDYGHEDFITGNTYMTDLSTPGATDMQKRVRVGFVTADIPNMDIGYFGAAVLTEGYSHSMVRI